VRVGVAGAGWWATTNHIPILAARDDVHLVGVCRPEMDLARKVQQHCGFDEAVATVDELIDLGLDALVVSTPHDLHHQHASAGLAAGLHVMCEKPMTCMRLMPGTWWRRWSPQGRHSWCPTGWHYKSSWSLRRSGSMRSCRTDRLLLVPHGFADERLFAGGGTVPSQWSPTLAAPAPSTWQDASRGGGYIHGQVTHSTALLFWLTGLRATTVSCQRIRADNGADMYVGAHATYDNGSVGVISGAATLPDDDKFQVDIRIFGEHGVLLIDVERERVELRRHDRAHRALEVPPGDGNYNCDVPPNRFIDLITGASKENNSPAEVAARSVEVLEGLHRSADASGSTVMIADLLGPRSPDEARTGDPTAASDSKAGS
jgi:predicted dehydrogenase